MGYPQFREPLPTDQWNDASPSESSEVILRLACFSNPQLWPFLSYNWLFLWDEIHSINGVFLVLITGISGHNCNHL